MRIELSNARGGDYLAPNFGSASAYGQRLRFVKKQFLVKARLATEGCPEDIEPVAYHRYQRAFHAKLSGSTNEVIIAAPSTHSPTAVIRHSPAPFVWILPQGPNLCFSRRQNCPVTGQSRQEIVSYQQIS